MSAFILPSKFSAQQRGMREIDWGNPITRGLLFFTAGDNRIDFVRKRRGTIAGSAATMRNGKAGRSPAFSANGYIWFERDTLLEPSARVTCWSFGARLTATTGRYSRTIGKTYNNNSSPYISYGMEINGDTAGQQNIQLAMTIAGTQFSLQANNTLPAVAAPFQAAATYDGATARIFVDGVQRNSVAKTGSISYDTTTTGRLIIANSASNANNNPLTGDVFATAVWNRALTAAELRSLKANPWQLFRPVRSYFYFNDNTPIDINASLESISLSTFAASVSADRDISAGQESISLQTFGADVQANIDVNISSALESISLVALQSEVQANIDSDIAGAQENIALITNVATVRANVDSDIGADLASIAVSAFQAGIAIGLNVASEQITLSTFLAAVTADRQIVGSLESILLSSNIAAVRLGTSVSAGAESITLQTNAAAVALDIALSAQLESIVITELAAQIKLSTHLDAALQSLTVTPYGAILTLGSGISAHLETLTLTTFGAVISASLPPIESPGLEYTMIGGRLHYTLPVSKLHFTFGS